MKTSWLIRRAVAWRSAVIACLCADTSNRFDPLDEKLVDVNVAVEYLRQYLGVRKVITLGHSGGATLMSAYQNAAENGVQAFQGPEKLIKCSDLGKLLPGRRRDAARFKLWERRNDVAQPGSGGDE